MIGVGRGRSRAAAPFGDLDPPPLRGSWLALDLESIDAEAERPCNAQRYDAPRPIAIRERHCERSPETKAGEVT